MRLQLNPISRRKTASSCLKRLIQQIWISILECWSTQPEVKERMTLSKCSIFCIITGLGQCTSVWLKRITELLFPAPCQVCPGSIARRRRKIQPSHPCTLRLVLRRTKLQKWFNTTRRYQTRYARDIDERASVQIHAAANRILHMVVWPVVKPATSCMLKRRSPAHAAVMYH